MANPDKYKAVIMRMMWQVFSMQTGPAVKTKEVITDMALMMHENGKR
jgi:hypothetical protein